MERKYNSRCPNCGCHAFHCICVNKLYKKENSMITKTLNAFIEVMYRNIQKEEYIEDIQKFIETLNIQNNNMVERRIVRNINEYLDFSFSRHQQIICLSGEGYILIVGL